MLAFAPVGTAFASLSFLLEVRDRPLRLGCEIGASDHCTYVQEQLPQWTRFFFWRVLVSQT